MNRIRLENMKLDQLQEETAKYHFSVKKERLNRYDVASGATWTGTRFFLSPKGIYADVWNSRKDVLRRRESADNDCRFAKGIHLDYLGYAEATKGIAAATAIPIFAIVAAIIDSYGSQDGDPGEVSGNTTERNSASDGGPISNLFRPIGRATIELRRKCNEMA